MEREYIYNSIIQSAITLGAQKGLNAITSRNLSAHAKINQYYIYHVFDSVNDVMFKANQEVDILFTNCVLDTLDKYDLNDARYETRRAISAELWDKLIKDADKYLYYLRYYHAYIFPNEYDSPDCEERFSKISQRLQPYLAEGADVCMILLMLLQVAVKFAVKIQNGAIDISKETHDSIFNFLFGSIDKFFKLPTIK